MPTPYIKKLAESGKGSVAELETKWEHAKSQAAKQGQDKNYAYVTKIFQSMVGASAVFADLKLNGHGHVVLREDGMRAKCGGPGNVLQCSICINEKELVSSLLTPVELGAAARLLSTSKQFFDAA